jgi:hypothetical protein
MPASLSPEVQECIRNCLDCYRACREMAMNQCLETGGRHVEPEHFRLMINCADICQTAADFMLSSSTLHPRICAACAEVCAACAQSCEDVGDMDACVQVCRKCAASCERMSAMAQGKSGRAPAHA